MCAHGWLLLNIHLFDGRPLLFQLPRLPLCQLLLRVRTLPHLQLCPLSKLFQLVLLSLSLLLQRLLHL